MRLKKVHFIHSLFYKLENPLIRKKFLALGLSILFLIFFNSFSGLAQNQYLYPVEQDNKWGYIDKTGEIVIEPQFDKAFVFSNGLGRVKKGEELYFLNIKGEEKLKFTQLYVKDFSEGLAAAKKKDGKMWGYINKKGDFVIEPQFYEAYGFSQGLAGVDTGNPKEVTALNGYIDKTGEMVIEAKYCGAREFSEGLAPVLVDSFVFGKWGYINKDGEMIIEPKYNEALSFSEGMAVVEIEPENFMEDDIWGYIDQEGKEVIELQYNLARSFSNGMAAVQLENDFWIYINSNGENIHDKKYKVAEPYVGNLARVSSDDASVGISHTGGEIDFMIGDLNFKYIDQNANQVWPKQD